MKAKSLKPSFTWKERRPLIQDRVFYVPDFYFEHDKFTFPGWESSEVFGNENPVHVEYCSGNGDWIVGKALANPNVNWVAVEKRFERVRKIWSKIKIHNIENLLVVCGEGLTFTQNYVSPGSVSTAYVNFPDPWPKDRHAKHRIVRAPFVNEMARILNRDGEMILVTDDVDYSLIMVDEMNRSEDFEASYPEPYFLSNVDDYGSSWFEQLWKEMGRVIRHIKYRRKAHSEVK
jgi:tRNA (guanine-N7-)-methyltransferase